jgi:hypothetical protein
VPYAAAEGVAYIRERQAASAAVATGVALVVLPGTLLRQAGLTRSLHVVVPAAQRGCLSASRPEAVPVAEQLWPLSDRGGELAPLLAVYKRYP